MQAVILTANKSQFLSFFVYMRQSRDRFRICDKTRVPMFYYTALMRRVFKHGLKYLLWRSTWLWFTASAYTACCRKNFVLASINHYGSLGRELTSFRLDKLSLWMLCQVNDYSRAITHTVQQDHTVAILKLTERSDFHRTMKIILNTWLFFNKRSRPFSKFTNRWCCKVGN